MSPFEKWRRHRAFVTKKLPPSSWLLCLLLLGTTLPLRAVDPAYLISQYAHTAWRVKDGTLNGLPSVIAQTSDGFLWIGTNVGLVRFDGVHFVPWNPPSGERLLDPRVISLQAAHDGSLWIGTGYSVSHWKDGKLINHPELSGRVEDIVEGDDGEVWLVRTQATDGNGPVCRIKEEQVRCFGAADKVSFPLAIHIEKGNEGELWVGGYSELIRWKPGSSVSYFAGKTKHPETFASLQALASGHDGSVWAAMDRKSPPIALEHFEQGKWYSRSFPSLSISNADITTLFVDRNHSLWIGTGSHGIIRVGENGIDHFGRTDGLSSDAIGSFYQDSEGDLWVVTSEGIDSFRDLKVLSYSMREGLSAAGSGSVLASRDGTVWVANVHALDFLRDGKLQAITTGHGLPGQFPTTMFEDHAGRLWVGIDNGLWVRDRGKFFAVRHHDGSALGIVFAITEDTQHNIWVRAGQNLDRILDRQVRDEVTSPQISTAYTLAANPRGGIFLGLVNGDLVAYDNGKTQTIPSHETGNTRQIRDLVVEPDGSVWGTTLDEVARWKDGVRRNLTTRNGLPCDGIFALVQDASNSLWLYTRCGLIEIDRAQLEQWWQQPDSLVTFRLYDTFDGVQPGLTSLKPQAVRSPDGCLWFVNGHILQTFDAAHPRTNPVPPPVHVEQILADRRSYSSSEALYLPALTRDLEIDYTALSFVSPQKVHFRYKLEGHDKNWQDPGSRRQAFYSDLRPGTYRFRVMASNNDGVWNEAGASLEFSVAPAWYQRTWFRLACVLAGLLAGWSLYQLRVRQIAKTMSARFDTRLAERTRMARELHDTFLQTIQGSKMVADDALDESADPARMRHAIQLLSVWLGQAMQEGRAALNSLRSSTTETNDLGEAFRRATSDGLVPGSMSVDFSVVGDSREMHPIVRDEVYRIGYEAIRNACKHSQASRLQVELKYTRDLALRISDNGVGIEPDVAGAGKAGHFGLVGMKERAARIGGKFSMINSVNSGTEINLVVPGSIVFRKPHVTTWSRIGAIFQRARRTKTFE